MQPARVVLVALALAASAAGAEPSGAPVEVEFIPVTSAHRHAASRYAAIWREDGERIVAALEARTCLPFAETVVPALVADAPSNSGGPAHPMRLRATYPPELKQSTLVHELGHRHLWQLAERVDELDGHQVLFLVLDRVWADVWGEAFAEARIRAESEWDARYDYASAWRWATSLTNEERIQLWNELLLRNGIAAGCRGPVDPDGSRLTRAEPK